MEKKKLRTTKEISELLNVSEETVRRWIRSGDLEATLDGKSYLVEEEALNKFINNKAKVAGTSISKMALGTSAIAGGIAAVAAANPIIGGAMGLLSAAAFLNKKKHKTGASSVSESISISETLNNQSLELEDIAACIQALSRKRKKIELEYQMKLLEIDNEIDDYTALKEMIERREK